MLREIRSVKISDFSSSIKLVCFQNIALNNESQKFAEKHGFDLTRLEYVRQLARDGVEGDFSFRELENDSMVSRLA